MTARRAEAAAATVQDPDPARRISRPAHPRVAGPGPPLAAALRNAAGVSIELLENGAVFAIRHGAILVNQVLGSPVEGGLGNLYLRRLGRTAATFVPIFGPGAPNRFRADADGATWDGSFDGLDYRCALRLHPAETTWFWTVDLVNRTGSSVSADAVLAQDLGLAHEDLVRSSEAYVSQYLDHTVLRTERFGILLASRQNLPQAGATPWIMHGCLDGAAGFLTDGVQLYGTAYRASNVPAALVRLALPNRVHQYEMAHPTVQSNRLRLGAGETGRITLFAAFEADHPAATGEPDVEAAVRAANAYRTLETVEPAVEARPRRRPVGVFGEPVPFASRDLDEGELAARFGDAWRHVERREGRLLSFFHGDGQHVVLRAKELVSERPTGLIMRSGRDLLPSDDALSVTAWMAGPFASQLTIGNTSFNKLLSVARHPLGALKANGLRVFVGSHGGRELLGLPSAMEMSPGSARWIYEGDRLTLVVGLATSLDDPTCRLTIDVERGGPVELLVTNEVVLGSNEHDAPGSVRVDAAAGRIELRPAPASLVRQRYPETRFFIVVSNPAAIDRMGGDELLHEDGIRRSTGHVVIRTRPVTHLSLALTGSILDATAARRRAAELGRDETQGGAAPEAAAAFWSGLGGGAALGGGTGRRADDAARLDDVIRWHLHDALVHATSPHGLEQSSGAAWGLRDACQGPVELFLATGHTDALREVLRLVYAHQHRRSGDWPQWFMVDRYRDVRAPGSHADIVHWPIKALCDYVEATGDTSVLRERVPYADGTPANRHAEPILDHVVRQVDRIARHCISGTSLPVFAGGDWEDTLQPADPAAAARTVSSWTTALEFQTLGRLAVVCERAGERALAIRLDGMCDLLRADFNAFLVPDGVVAGLAVFAPEGVEYLLHPRDRRTGVAYRLLPMTRGITGGMFNPEQAEHHADLIERHLLFPDGVRLQDRPMDYHGGTSRIFLRAESAANFGREVGLQYVHAHIRYVEAMAVLGRAEAAWAGLLAVCPILIERDVPSALPRQSNAYFSSSDADFADRYEAARGFGGIRSGRVGVKGGWRVYSSGPGIYLNQLVRNVLGLRSHYDDLVFDPVLPADADGLTFDRDEAAGHVRYEFRVSGGVSPSGVVVNGTRLAGGRYGINPYRRGGLLVSKAAFAAALDRDDNRVVIEA